MYDKECQKAVSDELCSCPASRDAVTAHRRLGSQASPSIGDIKLHVYTSNPTKLAVTVLGQQDKGKISKWTASDSWLCSGMQLGSLEMGSTDKASFFTHLKNANTVSTWILRILGFLGMWLAFCMLFAPLKVVGECVPFCGDFLASSIEALTVILTCCPALACAAGVAGIVWCAMRPLIGIPLMLIWICTVCGFCGFFIKKMSGREKVLPEGWESDAEYEEL
jgi:hypothetical protein